MKISDPAMLSFLFLLTLVVLYYGFRLPKEPVTAFIRIKVRKGKRIAVELVVDSLYSPVHLKTFNYSLGDILELEQVVLNFVKEKFNYEIALEDNIKLRDGLVDGRSFYLDVDDPDKMHLKLTVIYQKVRIDTIWVPLKTRSSKDLPETSMNL